MPVAMTANAAGLGGAVSTPWSRAKQSAVGPGFIVSFVLAILVMLALAIPDYGHAFTMCEAVAKSGRSACKMNAVNMFIMTVLLFIFLAPIAFFLCACGIYAYRQLVREPSIALAPVAPGQRRLRAPISARRVGVVRDLMRDLDLGAAAASGAEVSTARSVAATPDVSAVAEAGPVGGRPQPERDLTFASGIDEAPLALVEPDVTWNDPVTDQDIAAQPVMLAGPMSPAEPAEPVEPVTATAFALERVATVDGATIDLRGRLFPTRAPAGTDSKVVVLAHARARRDECAELPREARGGEPGALVGVAEATLDETDSSTPVDAIARLRLVAERGLADFLAARLPAEGAPGDEPDRALNAPSVSEPSGEPIEPRVSDAEAAQFRADLDTAVNAVEVTRFSERSAALMPVVEVALEDAAAGFLAPSVPTAGRQAGSSLSV